MKSFSKILHIAAPVTVLIALIFAGWHLSFGEIMFHTDIARDHLLIEEMVETQRPDLIGPRAGGIPGLFFGPVWYYAALPVFLIGNGDPVAIGGFYLFMVMLAILSASWVAEKIFGREVALLTAALYAIVLIPTATGFTQSFGSLILSPIIFYLLYTLSVKPKKKLIILLVLLLGLLFQLQPAFAMLMIFLSFILTIFIFYRQKKLPYLLFYFLIILPLANYLIFELRHDFLMSQAFWQFLANPPADRQSIDFTQLLTNRADGFVERLNFFYHHPIINIIMLGIHGFIFYKAFTDSKLRGRQFILLFYIFYSNFWLLTFLFKGLVWDFYHWGFLPLIIMMFATLATMIQKRIFLLLFIPIALTMLIQNGSHALGWDKTFSYKDSSSWLLNRSVAQYMYEHADGEDFGYYVYSPDEFGFSVRYALNYLDQFYPHTSSLCTKHALTYLVYYPTPTEGAVTDPRYWKEERANIIKMPDEIQTFPTDMIVEKYILTEEERAIPSDSGIICDLQFR